MKLPFYALPLVICLSAFTAGAQDMPVSSDGTVSSSDPSVTVAEPYMGEPGVVGGNPGMAGGYPQDEPPVDGFAPQIPPCGHQDLVGKNIKDVDVKALGTVRVLYPDSMVTEDYSPDRINIILEKGTDVITQVTCG